MASGLLSDIANPKIADVRGSFEEGRKIGQQNLTKDLAGEILSETLSSKVGLKAFQDLQKVNPDAAIKLKSILRSESDADSQFFVGLTNVAARMIENDSSVQDLQKHFASQVLIAQETGRFSMAQKLADTITELKDPESAKTVFKNILATREALGGKGTGQRQFEDLIAGFSPSDQVKAKRIAAGLEGRASNSALANAIAGGEETLLAFIRAEGQVAGAKEKGKLGQQLLLKPQIERLVTIAKKKAKESGESFTDLARMDAALPGLKNTVSQLRNLALVATSTMGGRAFDVMSKELGFGSTKGSTASAKFSAIVNNQILPLLKPTFGAAFTVQEGESLKATLGDPDAGVDEKLAQLDAFMAQKEQDILTKTREVDAFAPENPETLKPGERIMEDDNGNRAVVSKDGKTVIREL